jgi:hypothetical protein
MTTEEIQRHTDTINGLSQYEMCRQWRFGNPGQYPWFCVGNPLWPIWEKRFKELGGMTPEISKSLGWEC